MMNGKTANDQEWQNIEARINGLLKRCLVGESGILENKSQSFIPLPHMSSGNQTAEHQEMS